MSGKFFILNYENSFSTTLRWINGGGRLGMRF
jgi:hypothetical protein